VIKATYLIPKFVMVCKKGTSVLEARGFFFFREIDMNCIDSRPNKEAPLSNKNIAVRNILATQKNSFDLNNEYMSIHETLNNSFKNEDFSKNQNLNS